jgi:peptidoglycan/xylan/chitin deacetylase (PgdA/CDA1 family)
VSGALVVAYHAVEPGPPPLCVDPDLFRRQLDLIVAEGARALTVRELGERLRSGTLPDRAVAITFDDGLASVARIAAPLLRERGLTATVFCVAGRLGGSSDWPTQPPDKLRLPLATAAELAELAADGFEIGSHGWSHTPLEGLDGDLLDRELEESRRRLEDEVGTSVTSFAHPYGVAPPGGAAQLAAAGYRAACTTEVRRVDPADDPLALPRVDAWYLRRPALYRLALRDRLPLYLAARRHGALARRLVRKDFVAAARS